MICAVFDVLLAVNMCLNYSFYIKCKKNFCCNKTANINFVFAVLLQQKIFKKIKK